MHFSATILLAVLTIIGLSCNNDTNEIKAIKTDTLIVPTDSTTLYLPYPPKSEKDTSNRWKSKALSDSITVNNFSNVLFRFKEPIISKYNGKNGFFRFTWARSFDVPICIRIENLETSVRLILKVLDGLGGYELGKISLDTTINVSKEKWNTFISLVQNAGFWNMPNTNIGLGGTDGAIWLLEGIQDKHYHWVERWSPHKSDFAKACQYLISISPIKIEEKNIY
jgi:hypothetical protein